jgi:bacterioferritin
MLGYLQRAVRHEFAAAQQFTLQAVVARTMGDARLSADCENWAAEELAHAQRFAGALADSRASFGVGVVAALPVGGSVVEVIRQARMTEAAAVRLYREAERACHGVEPLRQLFETIGREEATHYEDLTRRLRQTGASVE